MLDGIRGHLLNRLDRMGFSTPCSNYPHPLHLDTLARQHLRLVFKSTEVTIALLQAVDNSPFSVDNWIYLWITMGSDRLIFPAGGRFPAATKHYGSEVFRLSPVIPKRMWITFLHLPPTISKENSTPPISMDNQKNQRDNPLYPRPYYYDYFR